MGIKMDDAFIIHPLGPLQAIFQVHLSDFVKRTGAGILPVKRTRAGQRKHLLHQAELLRAGSWFHGIPSFHGKPTVPMENNYPVFGDNCPLFVIAGRWHPFMKEVGPIGFEPMAS